MRFLPFLKQKLQISVLTILGTIGLVIALTFAVGAAAGYFPARRAADVDPMVTLRDE